MILPTGGAVASGGLAAQTSVSPAIRNIRGTGLRLPYCRPHSKNRIPAESTSIGYNEIDNENSVAVLFSLALGVTGVFVGIYLGVVLNESPDLRTGVKVFLILRSHNGSPS
jgi:hypothetical protein